MTTNVIAFPNASREFINDMAAASSVIALVAERTLAIPNLPQPRLEQLLAGLLERVVWLPRMSRADAENLVDAGLESRDALIIAEIGDMRANAKARDLLALWKDVWDLAETEELREAVMYAAALLWRLYRLEPQVLRETAT